MELDKRIKEGKKQLDCFDTEIAKQFIGKKGYFSHYVDNYADLKSTVLGTLGSTGDTFHESFCCIEEPFDNYYYEFFMPAEWVKEPEKKYRPFTLAEWIGQHTIGDVIKFRNSHNQEFHVMYSGYIFDTNDDIQDIRTKGQIMFVTSAYSFQELFDNYEICVYGEWQPFGVLDE